MGWVPIETTAEDLRNIQFRAYYDSFLDAQGQNKYIDRLEKDLPPGYKGDIREARGRLETFQKRISKYKILFPEQERIQDAQESFIDLGNKIFIRRIVITLNNGTQKIIEKKHDNLLP